jgi:hypothetical protein
MSSSHRSDYQDYNIWAVMPHSLIRQILLLQGSFCIFSSNLKVEAIGCFETLTPIDCTQYHIPGGCNFGDEN